MFDLLESIIRESLLAFAEEVATTGWLGREREAVSLFAFGYLVPRCRSSTPLYDPAQIGLDVAVGQPSGPNRKPQVCKDLVIWPRPGMTCWDDAGRPSQCPLAILEWKARTGQVSVYDEQWLQEYSLNGPQFVGYAISLKPEGSLTRLLASRVTGGTVIRGWLEYPAKRPSA